MADNEILAGLPFQKLNPERTALLVIDMQKYFTEPDHPFDKMMKQFDPDGCKFYLNRVEQLVIPNIQRLQKRYRSLGACIVYTEFGSMQNDGSDMAIWARKINDLGHDMVGSSVFPPFNDPSCRVDTRVGANEGELIFQKSTSGPANSTKMDHTLRVLGIQSVIVTGVVTEICVAQTTRELGDRDFNALVVEDACASMDETRHKSALETIGLTFGTVVSTDQAIALVQK
ncbi:MAG: cysteine hydrolase [Deltaproteobacteria bacterium]|nr:cysteine hydrolase [Deltaproteobacteria bacterium]